MNRMSYFMLSVMDNASEFYGSKKSFSTKASRKKKKLNRENRKKNRKSKK